MIGKGKQDKFRRAVWHGFAVICLQVWHVVLENQGHGSDTHPAAFAFSASITARIASFLSTIFWIIAFSISLRCCSVISFSFAGLRLDPARRVKEVHTGTSRMA